MKVTINGEVFEFDPVRKPLAEALALENALKIPYEQYEKGLREGSARSVAGFIWLVWRRNGKDVPLADILSGEVPVDLNDLEVEDEGDGDGEPGPTGPPPPASSTPGGSGSARSPKSSTSARGNSAT